MDGFMIIGQNDFRFIKGIQPFEVGNSRKHFEITTMLSGMAFENVLKKDKTAYLATLVKVKPDVQIEVSYNIAELLAKFKYVRNQFHYRLSLSIIYLY